MAKIAEQPPAKKALKIAETVRKLGFNVTFLSSKRYVLKKLGSLKPEDLKKVRETLKENVHPRFMRNFSTINPTAKPDFSKKKSTQQTSRSLRN